MAERSGDGRNIVRRNERSCGELMGRRRLQGLSRCGEEMMCLVAGVKEYLLKGRGEMMVGCDGRKRRESCGGLAVFCDARERRDEVQAEQGGGERKD